MAAFLPVFRLRSRRFAATEGVLVRMSFGPVGASGLPAGRARLVAAWRPDPTGRLCCGWSREAAVPAAPPH